MQQQAAADLLPDPLQAVADVVSAYTAEQGFRQMSVQELSVALTAGGLIDLLLDVRSHEEFTAGGQERGWQLTHQVAPDMHQDTFWHHRESCGVHYTFMLVQLAGV